MAKEEFLSEYSHVRYVPTRGYCGIQQMLFTCGLFVTLDEYGYKGRYCYRSEEEAVAALEEWDGEGDPSGDWLAKKGFQF